MYSGPVVGKEGIRPNSEKIAIIKKYPVPTNCNEVRSFVAFASYYRRFIKGFATIATPIHALLKKGVKFKWSEECQQSFDQLRRALLSASIIAYPNFKEIFTFYTDASNTGLGAVLSQNINGVEKTIAFASSSLKRYERKYTTIERESPAIVWGIKHFRPYLYGKMFDIITDHNPLKWLNNASYSMGYQAL